jgi:transposase
VVGVLGRSALLAGFPGFLHRLTESVAFTIHLKDRTMRTRLQPLMSVAEMLRRHKPLLLNWFRARGEFSAGCVEGMNGKAKLTMKKAYGFKSYNVAEVALLHTLGKLPTPQVTHRFW